MISIIVPIYNGEATLERCVSSVMAQTYRDWELILVDDGSVDSSLAICNASAMAEPRIRVVHQENKGVVAARNVGVSAAQGEWIGFVDCDDLLEADMLQKMMAMSDGADIVWCDVRISSGEQSEIIRYNPCNDIVHSLLTTNTYGWLWNKIYRRSFVEKVSLLNDAKTGIMEDSYWLLRLYLQNPVVRYVDKPLYVYCESENSATSRPYVFGRAYANILAMYEVLKREDRYEVYRQEYDALLIKSKIDLLRMGEYRQSKPHVESRLKNIPLKYPMNLFYWFCLNGGKCGKLIYRLYSKLI